MKIQHPLLVRAIGAAGAGLIRRWVGTTRFHFRYADPASTRRSRGGRANAIFTRSSTR